MLKRHSRSKGRGLLEGTQGSSASSSSAWGWSCCAPDLPTAQQPLPTQPPPRCEHRNTSDPQTKVLAPTTPPQTRPRDHAAGSAASPFCRALAFLPGTAAQPQHSPATFPCRHPRPSSLCPCQCHQAICPPGRESANMSSSLSPFPAQGDPYGTVQPPPATGTISHPGPKAPAPALRSPLPWGQAGSSEGHAGVTELLL